MPLAMKMPGQHSTDLATAAGNNDAQLSLIK